MGAVRRSFVFGSVMGGLVLALGASPALAHVEIAPESAPRGSLSVLNFVVPNESETASTVQLEILFPTNRRVLTAAVQPIPGWTATVEKSASGSGSQTVSKVTWTGGSFGPGEFQQFFVRVGLPEKGTQMVFKALQTYSDGEVVRWIEKTVKGAPEPEHPAPTLQLTAEGEGHD